MTGRYRRLIDSHRVRGSFLHITVGPGFYIGKVGWVGDVGGKTSLRVDYGHSPQKHRILWLYTGCRDTKEENVLKINRGNREGKSFDTEWAGGRRGRVIDSHRVRIGFLHITVESGFYWYNRKWKSWLVGSRWGKNVNTCGLWTFTTQAQNPLAVHGLP